MGVIPQQLTSANANLRKKATNCLGAFALILNKAQLLQLVKLITDKIRTCKDKGEFLTHVQCFGWIARNVGNKIAQQQVADVVPVLKDTISKVISVKVSIDIDNEIAEACLSAMESLIRKASKEVEGFIGNYLVLASQALTFDPNYEYIEGADQEMEDAADAWGDEEIDMGAGGQDDDDSSWKVRRAAVKVIDGIINSCPAHLRDVYRNYARLLADRFKERDENVKCAILETFQNLLKAG